MVNDEPMADSTDSTETDSTDTDSTETDSTELLLTDISAGVATLTLNRPERKNSLSAELVDALGDGLDAAMTNDDVRVVVLTNSGNTFCAGADLKAQAPGVSAQAKHSFVGVMQQIMNAPKPVIGRANGHAIAGGVGLIAACDISVMRDDAKIGFTEARIGVSPAVISVVCLPKMRRADASELFLTAERFTPQRAADVGLINAAVPADQLDEVIEEYLDKVVRGGPLALAACKELITRVPNMSTEEAFDWATPFSAELFQSAEGQAGIAAFNERKPAPWIPAERAGTENR
jgi:methylglutaconyl-CoA hydratase